MLYYTGTDGQADMKLICGTRIAGMSHRTRKDDKVSCPCNFYFFLMLLSWWSHWRVSFSTWQWFFTCPTLVYLGTYVYIIVCLVLSITWFDVHEEKKRRTIGVINGVYIICSWRCLWRWRGCSTRLRSSSIEILGSRHHPQFSSTVSPS